MFRQLREWKRQKERADRLLEASEDRIVDMAKRLVRLQAEVELHELAAKRRGSR